MATERLRDLAEELITFEDSRTDAGWTVDDAVRRSHVERVLAEMLTAPRAVAEDSDRFECAVPIELVDLRAKRSYQVTLDGLHHGGVSISVPKDVDFGAKVELRAGRRRVRGTITARPLGQVHVALEDEGRVSKLLDVIARAVRQGF